MHLVIPFASALSEAAVHALGTLSLPNLERLLARWRIDHDNTPENASAAAPELDEYTLSPPHERVLARLRHWPVADGLLPFAADAARHDGLTVEPGSGWGLVTPAHWLLARDHISMLDPATLALAEDEARPLHAALAPLFEEMGWAWHWASPQRWYVSHPCLTQLPTASLDRVIGRNIDLWLNQHPGAALMRRLQSEAQMTLYTHPLNDARSARGALTVNSFWLSGTGPTPATAAPPAALAVDTRLRASALTEDWSGWSENWHALDAGPVRTLAELAAAEPLNTHRLTLCGERLARTWQSGARPWWTTIFSRTSVHALPLLSAL